MIAPEALLGAMAAAAVLRVELLKIENRMRRMPCLCLRRFSRHPITCGKQSSQCHGEGNARNALSHAAKCLPACSRVILLFVLRFYAESLGYRPALLRFHLGGFENDESANRTEGDLTKDKPRPINGDGQLRIDHAQEAKINAVQINGVTMPPHNHSNRAGNIGRSTA